MRVCVRIVYLMQTRKNLHSNIKAFNDSVANVHIIYKIYGADMVVYGMLHTQ